MDRTERIIQEHLQFLGIGPVTYKPDGNIPPDFSVDGRIAVEARRLNQHTETEATPVGLEVTSVPLQTAVLKALRQAGPTHASRSWYVHCRVRRPLPTWKAIERSLRDAVQHFCQQLPHPPSELFIDEAIQLRFTPTGRAYDTLLLLGSFSDDDTGGFVVSELLRNVRICIDNKTRKIAPVRYKYPEWWLALEDRIAYGTLDRDQVVDLRAALGDVSGFTRVLLVNPLKPTCGLDLLDPVHK